MCIVQDARAQAIEAVRSHCMDGGTAWRMAESVSAMNGWSWAKSTITGMDYAAMILMFDILVNGDRK